MTLSTTMIVIAISSFLFYIYTIEPQWIDFKNIDLNLPNLSKEFEGWKIVQVSDIHISEWMTEKR
ncbi:MAG: metallophosphoesterase, partial [Cyanobacteria bacterium]|nr:metallophosphoesterase [Cyanobacteria bacterium CG_2015-02_32_10]